MAQRFSSFVMLAGMRTGSNFLEANLNALGGVACHGEAYNPHFIGKLNQDRAFGWGIAQRDADPLGFLAAMRAGTPGLPGFRYFHDHDPRVFPAVMDDAACAKIVLARNPLETYVSWKTAQATGQWKLTNVARHRSATVRFEEAEFRGWIDAQQGFLLRVLRHLQASGQAAFWIDYDDLQDLDVLNGLAAWLGVPGRLEAADDTLKKQNPEPVLDRVENVAAMEAALARLDRFNLARTPVFEPRRAASVPQFVAAGPVMVLPLRGGPEEAVARWLGSLGPLQRDFTQKTLRAWRRANPRGRVIAALRHPVPRAWVALRERLATGALPEVRAGFIRTMKVDLPPPTHAATLTPETGRDLFLAFLRFARMNLSGQTAVRVDAHVASQAAIVQGCSAVQPPDLILREERLAEGLAFVAAETGLALPLPPPARAPACPWGAEIEEAAREAYARDYAAFGFGPWGGS
jgi:hypothetical protein